MTETQVLSSVIELDVDIATVEEPQPLPASIYPATIIAAEVKESKKGTLYASVTFQVAAENYPADYVDGNPEGTQLRYMRASFAKTPAAQWQLRKFLQTIGAPMSNRIDVNEWVGLTSSVEVVHEVYEGITRANIKRIVD